MIRILSIFLLLSSIQLKSIGSEDVADKANGPKHFMFEELLSQHVTSNGIVNYSALAHKRPKLDIYLNMLSQTSPSALSKDEQLAFWINAYNAYTIALILDNMPLKSIKEINNGKAWDLKFVKINNEELSLNQIEHEKIRPVFNEPRIHFALVCAAKGCPKLYNHAFTANNLEQSLVKLTREFLLDTSKNKLGSTPLVSKLFEWYPNDFNKYGGVIKFINTYTTGGITGNSISGYMEYNWDLNGN